jgi:hypothetical protein
VIAFLFACTPEPSEVEVRTTIGADRDEDPEGVVPGAKIDIYDAGTQSFGHATAGDDGKVTLHLPFGGASFVVLHADGYLPTSYSLGPFYDDGAILDRNLWLRSNGSQAALEKEFASGCSSAGTDGGVSLEGEVRLYIEGQTDLETLPLVTTASVTAYDTEGSPQPACYLDDEGKPSADAATTGETGRFAIFGVEAGTITLEVTYVFVTGDEPTNFYFAVAEDGGAVPYYPALVFGPI